MITVALTCACVLFLGWAAWHAMLLLAAISIVALNIAIDVCDGAYITITKLIKTK